jgi:hypothetical protein
VFTDLPECVKEGCRKLGVVVIVAPCTARTDTFSSDRRPRIPIRRQFYTRSSDSGELKDASASCPLAGSNEERWSCDEDISRKGSSHGAANSASILKDRGFDLQDLSDEEKFPNSRRDNADLVIFGFWVTYPAVRIRPLSEMRD